MGKKKLTLKPFQRVDGSMVYPIEVSGQDVESGILDAEDLMRMSHRLTDAELNKVLNQQVKDLVEAGAVGKWPEDDTGIVMWFLHDFITDEMREVFPYISREYLANETMIRQERFTEVPVPHMMEQTLQDAYNYRILAMMLSCARKGSVYSRNFLLSLYKVYYKSEYNRLKRLTKLQYMDILELFDEDCKEKGYSSGHTTDNRMSYKEQIIENRRHEAGWTNVFGQRSLSPVMDGSEKSDDDARALAGSMANAPDEPPIDPVASRLFIMCEMLNTEIDVTCNLQAKQICESIDALLHIQFDENDELRRICKDIVDRNRQWILIRYPEAEDPVKYQSNERYGVLELVEHMMYSVFDLMGRNVRIPYDSRKFDLSTEMAHAVMMMDVCYPDIDITENDIFYLAYIHYLSECLCDAVIERDNELDEILHMERKRRKGEWKGGAGDDITSEEAPQKTDGKAAKLLHTVENFRQPVKPEPKKPSEPEVKDTDDLQKEIAELKARLTEKEAALAEAEQKAIRQRALYEKAHEKEIELTKQVADAATEHTELIAIRDYLYNQEVIINVPEDIPQKDMISRIQSKKVAVLGGDPRWCRKMKQVLPDWSFVPVEDMSIGAFNALEKAEYVYIYTGALKHAQYYKAMDIVRRGNKMLYYLGTTNIEENIRRFYSDLCERTL